MNTETDFDLNSLMENLGLIEDGDPSIDVDNLPKERSSVPRELPQPGAIKLRLPGNIKEAIKAVNVTGLGQRMQLKFADDVALVAVNSGQQVTYNVSGAEFANKKDGQVVGFTSELARLLKAVGYQGTLASKGDQVKGVLESAGKEFLVDVSYETRCNPEKPIYKDRAKQAQNGCGQKFRLKAESYKDRNGVQVNILPVPRDSSTGMFKQKFECTCGAELGVFLRLSNYRAAK